MVDAEAEQVAGQGEQEGAPGHGAEGARGRQVCQRGARVGHLQESTDGEGFGLRGGGEWTYVVKGAGIGGKSPQNFSKSIPPALSAQKFLPLPIFGPRPHKMSHCRIFMPLSSQNLSATTALGELFRGWLGVTVTSPASLVLDTVGQTSLALVLGVMGSSLDDGGRRQERGRPGEGAACGKQQREIIHAVSFSMSYRHRWADRGGDPGKLPLKVPKTMLALIFWPQSGIKKL